MLIISRTPVRISFFGGGSDYPDYFRRNPGAVLGTTIDKYTHVSISTPGNYFDHKIRIGYSRTELVKTLDEIEHPSVRECLKFRNCTSNLDIHIFSDLPARTGLGSSSSFTVGFLNALYALEGQKVSKQRLAEESCFIEQERICERVGSQDQFHAAFGGFNVIEFKGNSVIVRPVITTQQKIESLERHLLLFYTGQTRHASEILQEQIVRTRDLSNDQYLRQMVDMVYQAEEMISREPETSMIPEFGRLLDKSWDLKKRLSSKISNPFIDEAYMKALRAGAYGGKLCGAGSGGFLLLLSPPQKHAEIKAALHELAAVPIRFENPGSTIIYMKD